MISNKLSLLISICLALTACSDSSDSSDSDTAWVRVVDDVTSELTVSTGNRIVRFCPDEISSTCIKDYMAMLQDSSLGINPHAIHGVRLTEAEQRTIADEMLIQVELNRYSDARDLLRFINLGMFTENELTDLAIQFPSISNHSDTFRLEYDITRRLSHAGRSAEVYKRLLAWAEKDLTSTESPRATTHLRAYLIHYGCMKTAMVWKEITPDYGSNIPQGGKYPEITVTKSDLAEVVVQRLELRRNHLIPVLQDDCPINMGTTDRDSQLSAEVKAISKQFALTISEGGNRDVAAMELKASAYALREKFSKYKE
ncbi:MAG: hypothetical protein HRT95_05700 [Moritella sp.]|uniref:hypothetical protein n=1 Tax=Moritella sp. TaxID=78556 RepID=UPI001D1D5D2A|nr:hypothetical protein [Moritella sp.]NQZ49685.1 hypothetical protein [Moritella sp.]